MRLANEFSQAVRNGLAVGKLEKAGKITQRTALTEHRPTRSATLTAAGRGLASESGSLVSKARQEDFPGRLTEHSCDLYWQSVLAACRAANIIIINSRRESLARDHRFFF